MNRLEFPAGRVLFEDNAAHANRISVSPSGDRVAFVFKFDLHVTEPGGGVRDLRERAMEAVWCRATNEIWFNSVAGGSTELFAVVPGRPKRRVTTLPGDFVLHDISSDGRVLLGRVTESSEIFADFPGEARPRNLSHLDRSVAVALAPGGDTLLFNETGQSDRSVYLRRTDGSPPKRLADGYAWALSPDGRFALVGPRPGPEMWLVPTGPGQPRLIATPGLRRGGRMGFFPDGRRVWFLADDSAHERRAWALDLDGGKPRALTPPGVAGMTLSGDGRLSVRRRGRWRLDPLFDGDGSIPQGRRHFPRRGADPVDRGRKGLCPRRGRAAPRRDSHHHPRLPPRSAHRTPGAVEGDPAHRSVGWRGHRDDLLLGGREDLRLHAPPLLLRALPRRGAEVSARAAAAARI